MSTNYDNTKKKEQLTNPENIVPLILNNPSVAKELLENLSACDFIKIENYFNLERKSIRYEITSIKEDLKEKINEFKLFLSLRKKLNKESLKRAKGNTSIVDKKEHLSNQQSHGDYQVN